MELPRYFRGKRIQRPQLRLMRGADGRLRPADEAADVGDVWAEQKRIRLAEAIQDDKQRARRKQKRKAFLGGLTAKIRRSSGDTAPKGGTPRELVLNIHLPKFKVAQPLAALKKVPQKYLLLGGGLAVLALIALSVVILDVKPSLSILKKQGTTTSTLAKNAEKPTYATLLPDGKAIEELGGWKRVSPEGKAAVFAFVDTINGVQISVSEQPLPESFRQDVSGSIAKLAEQFTANEKITSSGITAYIGTSVKGPQSVILAKNDLLILIKSTQVVPNEIWGTYISLLK